MFKRHRNPPYAISRKNECEGASVFQMKSYRDNAPPRNDLGKFNNKIKDVF